LYLYQGPIGSATLRLAGKQEQRVKLSPNHTVELPPDHVYTRRLVARGHLTEVPAAVEVAPVETPSNEPASSNTTEQNATQSPAPATDATEAPAAAEGSDTQTSSRRRSRRAPSEEETT
jgi:hypothetical protein